MRSTVQEGAETVGLGEVRDEIRQQVQQVCTPGCAHLMESGFDEAKACVEQLPYQTINGVAVPMPACPAACWNVVQLTTGEEAANCSLSSALSEVLGPGVLQALGDVCAEVKRRRRAP